MLLLRFPKIIKLIDYGLFSRVAPEALLSTKKHVFDGRIYLNSESLNSESSSVVLGHGKTTHCSPVVFVARHLAR